MTSRFSMGAFLVPFLGLVLASCSTTDNPSATKGATCEPVPEGEGLGWDITASTLSREGRELLFRRRALVLGDDGSSAQVDTTVEADGERVMVIAEEISSARQKITIDYGAAVPGPTATRIILENGTLSGTIHGRELVPMAVDEAGPTAVRFEDGEPPPSESGVNPDIEDALPDLLKAASSAAEKCVGMNGTVEAQQAVVGKRGDRGHVSSPTFSSGCIECKAGCLAAEAACALAGFACASLPWPANLICIAAEETSCFVAYLVCIGVCNADGSPCCPVGCGDGCCESQETCMTPAARICCGPGQTTCLGTECCDNTEVCIDAGPNAGTCCDPANRCVDACCNPTDSCLPGVSLCCSAEQTPCVDKCCDTAGCIDTGPNAGTCCEFENICGTSCCEGPGSCIPSLSLCCGFATPACGNKCCNAGESCLGGLNCCPNERLCAGTCCIEGSGCDLTTNTCKACPMPNTKFCSQGGGICCPTTQVCPEIPGGECCPSGQLWCTQVFPARCTIGSECLN
jgi:hypothetical protein